MSNQNEKLSTGGWILTFIITAIPVIGLIMLFVWAFGSYGNPRQNWARAILILAILPIIIIVALVITGIPLFGTDGTSGLLGWLSNIGR